MTFARMDSRDCMTCAFCYCPSPVIHITMCVWIKSSVPGRGKEINVSGYKAICTEGSMEQRQKKIKKIHEAQWNSQPPQ